MSTNTPTVVLVHGALTDASVWHTVIAKLHERNYRVIAPAMPMRGLASDAAYLRSFLTTLEGPIVIAGHSYGGSIISRPDALTAAVRALVFIAAFQQDRGESAGELNARFPGSKLTADAILVREYPGGNELYLQQGSLRRRLRIGRRRFYGRGDGRCPASHRPSCSRRDLRR